MRRMMMIKLYMTIDEVITGSCKFGILIKLSTYSINYSHCILLVVVNSSFSQNDFFFFFSEPIKATDL